MEQKHQEQNERVPSTHLDLFPQRVSPEGRILTGPSRSSDTSPARRPRRRSNGFIVPSRRPRVLLPTQTRTKVTRTMARQLTRKDGGHMNFRVNFRPMDLRKL